MYLSLYPSVVSFSYSCSALTFIPYFPYELYSLEVSYRPQVSGQRGIRTPDLCYAAHVLALESRNRPLRHRGVVYTGNALNISWSFVARNACPQCSARSFTPHLPSLEVEAAWQGPCSPVYYFSDQTWSGLFSTGQWHQSYVQTLLARISPAQPMAPK